MNFLNSNHPVHHGWGDRSAEQSLPNVDSLDRPVSSQENPAV